LTAVEGEARFGHLDDQVGARGMGTPIVLRLAGDHGHVRLGL
jgi:hypothetical protein